MTSVMLPNAFITSIPISGYACFRVSTSRPTSRILRRSSPRRARIAPVLASASPSSDSSTTSGAGTNADTANVSIATQSAGAGANAAAVPQRLPDVDARTLLRFVSWGSLGLFVFLARPFFPVMLGTFIVSYVANSVTTWAVKRTNGRVPRRLFVVCFFVTIVLLITAFSLMTVPSIVREAQYFVRTLQSDNPYVVLANTMRKVLGEELADKVETFITFSSDAPLAAGVAATGATVADGTASAVENSRRLGVLLHNKLKGYISGAVALTTKLIGALTKVVFKALLSLVFSFMIMWDLPRVKRGVTALKHSKLSFMYYDLAPAITQFASVVGKAFEAQGAIAVVNTALTTCGLILLQVPGVGFLSVVTLLCSFIPVAGVFISTTPMVILALSEYGVATACWVVVMVILVHLVEAYVLNPQIYSTHLHLHPLFVIAVLYVAEHSFGVAGLLMAVPVAVYLLRAVVQIPQHPPVEQASPHNQSSSPELLKSSKNSLDATT